MTTNTWLPGNKTYTFGTGATLTLANAATSDGATIAVQRCTIANNSSGMGITHDMISPPFSMTRPPKIAYAATQNMNLVLKDAGGWMWAAPMPAQPTVQLRAWSWDKFQLHSTQEATGTPPETPTPGGILTYQFAGADGGTLPVTLDLAYITATVPTPITPGPITKANITVTDPGAFVLKVGDVGLVNGARREIKYYGSLPFGLQTNGPTRNGRSVTPYRGPYIAGYQSGTPWLDLGDQGALSRMLDFMLDAQTQFQQRHPDNLLGPFMHCYLPAVWDSVQNGPLDTWVWDAPDGNPAWNGWQYRAFDSMGHTWALAVEKGSPHAGKAATICTRFLTWIAGWFAANPTARSVPDTWAPPG